MHPEERVRCDSCGTVYSCGDAPHDEEGSFCPACGSTDVTEYVPKVRGK
jgi:rRNA maturation endonuclease Nob1